MNRSRRTLLMLGTAVVLGVVNLVFSSSKSVYDVNAVGYLNVQVTPGLNLIGLTLKPESHEISRIFNNVLEGTTIYKMVDGIFTTNSFQNGQWDRPDETWESGEGVFILNPNANPFTLTLVGEVMQGDLTNSIPQGLSLRSCVVPKQGKITRNLLLKLSPFDNISILTNGVLEVFTYLPDGNWNPYEPTVGSAEAFVVNAAQATNWTFHFEVNP